MSSSFTFRDLERAANVEIEDEPSSALELWYSRVRDMPIDQFSDADLAVACRQRLYLDSVAPISLERLADNPLAGEMYDGELLAAIASVPGEVWATNVGLKDQLRKFVSSLAIRTDDVDVTSAINALRVAADT
jgi:hypothetical protein